MSDDLAIEIEALREEDDLRRGGDVLVTFIASPYTGLIYGSTNRWASPPYALREQLDRGPLFAEASDYYDFRLVPDNEVPEWAQGLTPGEYVQA